MDEFGLDDDDLSTHLQSGNTAMMQSTSSASIAGVMPANLAGASNEKIPPEFQAKIAQEKIKMLLKANDALRKQMIQKEKESKDNVRVKRIKKLEAEVEEKQVFF